LVEFALAEDLGSGDITSSLAIAPSAQGQARIEAREPLVVCGLPVAAEVFRQVDPELTLTGLAHDGDFAQPGDRLLEIRGSTRNLLSGERTALNFMARLCGIATQTRRYVDAVSCTGTSIVDTRKTLPGWRLLDKYAVAVGGGVNHRIGLFDGILLKDNHIAAAGSLEAAVKSTRSSAPANLRVQVEVESEAQAAAACEAGADFLLLDNCSPDEVRSIVERFRDRAILEASGGITLENVCLYAETGVHRISIGALTHSAPGSDLALEMDTVDGAP
jgi:nicotinate-nucleotide pyrophosphorylase (carboxylating)